jgi:endonuclease YncB( thermonuclease family)
MKEAVPSAVANVALAVGVTLAVAIAIGFTLVHRQHTASSPVILPAPAPAYRVVHLTLPPPPEPTVSGLRASDTLEPFDPPPPPIAETEPMPGPSAGSQLASLSPTEPAATTAAASAPPVPMAPADALSALRTVALDTHDIHRIPDRDPPMRSVTIVNRGDRPLPAGHAPATPAKPSRMAMRDTAAVGASNPVEAQGGANLDGQAIVTAAIELNVDGKPLTLYGVKPPAASDMCAPNAAHAARSCPDVSRQALAAEVGAKGDVSCRILAVGGRSALPAVCTDRKGQDLGTWLVTHGFALSDANNMVDYSDAETKARSDHNGLWNYR